MFNYVCFFFFKQKTAYEMRISDWSSDVCSSDLTISVSELPVWFTSPAPALTCAFDSLIRPLMSFDALAERWASARTSWATTAKQIGRASCRERVCQYV